MPFSLGNLQIALDQRCQENHNLRFSQPGQNGKKLLKSQPILTSKYKKVAKIATVLKVISFVFPQVTSSHFLKSKKVAKIAPIFISEEAEVAKIAKGTWSKVSQGYSKTGKEVAILYGSIGWLPNLAWNLSHTGLVHVHDKKCLKLRKSCWTCRKFRKFPFSCKMAKSCEKSCEHLWSRATYKAKPWLWPYLGKD